MDYQYIKVEKREHVTIVTINRSDVRNALHPPACKEMDHVFNEFSENPDEWVAIITGSGAQAFCAGNDLKWQAENGKEALRKGLDALKGGFGGITRRFDCYKPIIAAVNGLAFGGGFEIVLACDIVIAVDNAKFALPEVKVGMMAGAGGVHRLPRYISYARAMGMILTGRPMTAQEAFQFGIVNEIVSTENLLNTAQRWANDITACAPLAVSASKEACIEGMVLPLREAIPKRFPRMEAMSQSEDYLEGPRSFAEKRKPKWKGK